MKDAYIAKATELRRKISIAKAELERIKAKKKNVKKGKKNRAMLENDCGNTGRKNGFTLNLHSAKELQTYLCSRANL